MQGADVSGTSPIGAATTAVPAALRRGLSLIKDKRWMDALDVFSALSVPPAPIAAASAPSVASANAAAKGVATSKLPGSDPKQSGTKQQGATQNTTSAAEALGSPAQTQSSSNGSSSGKGSTTRPFSVGSFVKKALAKALPGLGSGAAGQEQAPANGSPLPLAPPPAAAVAVSADELAAWAGDFAKLCRLKLELPAAGNGAATAQGVTSKAVTPVRHLASALMYANPQLMGTVTPSPDFSLPGLSRSRNGQCCCCWHAF